MENPELLEGMQSTVSNYVNLLSRMDQLTDSLYTAIQDSDIDSVDHLLQARSALVNQISETSSSVMASIEKLRAQNGASVVPNSPGWDTVRTRLEDASRLENALLQKQTSCEYALGQKMDACKKEMSSITVHRGLNNAYRKPSGSPSSRFLDDKM